MPFKQSRIGYQNQTDTLLPPEIATQIRTMYFTSVVSVVLLILSAMQAVFAIAAAFSGNWRTAAVFAVQLLLSVGSLVLIHVFYARKAAYTLCAFPCERLELRQLSAAFSAESFGENCCGATFLRSGTQFTLHMYQTECCDLDTKKRMRKALQGHAEGKDISIGDSGKYAKINLILCDTAVDPAKNQLPALARQNIHRTECLFHAILCRGESTLYIPRVFDDLDYLQVKRYAAFCRILADIAAMRVS